MNKGKDNLSISHLAGLLRSTSIIFPAAISTKFCDIETMSQTWWVYIELPNKLCLLMLNNNTYK